MKTVTAETRRKLKRGLKLRAAVRNGVYALISAVLIILFFGNVYLHCLGIDF